MAGENNPESGDRIPAAQHIGGEPLQPITHGEKLCPGCGRRRADSVNRHMGVEPMGSCAYHISSLFLANCQAEQIRRLSEEVARLNAERQWIPVGERMPDMLQLVAAWCPDFVEPVAGIIRPHHSMASKRVLDTSLGEGYGFEYFTHWAPLPEPPK